MDLRCVVCIFLLPTVWRMTSAGIRGGLEVYSNRSVSNVEGIDFRSRRVYGGSPVAIAEVPFMALFRPVDEAVGCGASIVHEQFVVSAKHCYVKYILQLNRRTRVTVGTDQVYGGEHYDVDKFFIDNPEIWSDILVIKLMKRLTFSSHVQPIKMAPVDLVIQDGDFLEVIGFGKTERGVPSDWLLRASVLYMNQQTCTKIYAENMPSVDIYENMLCAGGEPGRGSCRGDSGGPLTYKGLLVGVVFFGLLPCTVEGVPGVYTRVSVVREFIENVITYNQ